MVIENYSGSGVEMRNGVRKNTNLKHFNGKIRRYVSEDKIKVGDVIFVEGRPEPVCEVYNGWGANRDKFYVKNAKGEIVYRFKRQKFVTKYREVLAIVG